jgi:hypothetical protein
MAAWVDADEGAVGGGVNAVRLGRREGGHPPRMMRGAGEARLGFPEHAPSSRSAAAAFWWAEGFVEGGGGEVGERGVVVAGIRGCWWRGRRGDQRGACAEWVVLIAGWVEVHIVVESVAALRAGGEGW